MLGFLCIFYLKYYGYIVYFLLWVFVCYWWLVGVVVVILVVVVVVDMVFV